MFGVEMGYAVPLGDVNEVKSAASQVSLPDALELAEAAKNGDDSFKTEFQSKAG